MNNIKEKRLALEMSQEEMAKLIGVDRSSIAKWENGFTPTVANLRKIAKILKCKVDDLLCPTK